MYRSSPVRMYGPLALIATVQLVVVLLSPPGGGPTSAVLASSGQVPGAAAGLDPSGSLAPGAPGGAGADPGAPGAPGAPGTTGTTGTAAAGGGTTPAQGATSAAGRVATGGAAGPAGTLSGPATGAVATGSTAHCVAGRQFDPAVDYYAPPCAPGAPGVAAANPGATSMGVTGTAITVVHYVGTAGAEVDTILKAQGLYYNAESAAVVDAAYARYMNKTYQLYGRRIEIRTVQGTCRLVPPDQQCLNAEMNRIAKQYKPFAVFFQTTVCSACFAELARNKVVTFGGAGFSDEFRADLRPYNYDAGMSSTRMARVFADWWCHQMDGRPAVYAGSQNPAQDFRTQKRRLGVVSTNDPDNETTIRKVLYPALKAGCGASVGSHEYFYEQNVGTAATQSQAGTAVMNSRVDPATSVVCFCDPVAPQFSYNASTNNNYWPEVLFAANQAQDTDSAAQTYEGGLACPQSSRGCAFDTALGLGTADKAVPPAQLSGVKVYAAAATQASPVTPLTLQLFWRNYNMFASLLQAAGPTLTPAALAAGAPRLGSRGGGSSGFGRVAFEDGELSWGRDVFLDYWNKNRTSPYNGAKGSFVQAAAGRRFGLGEFPTAAQPPVPVSRN